MFTPHIGTFERNHGTATRPPSMMSFVRAGSGPA
jgi:hypothetical protein